MAQSLLAYLYSRIRGSQEDIATIALQYLLSQSDALNNAFTHLLSTSLGMDLDDNLRYFCQAVGEDQERPDMEGIDSVGREQVLCEMKFYAGLTHNQPLSYLDRLKEKQGQGLIFVCPKARMTSLWMKLKDLCATREVQIVHEHCIRVDGIAMSIMTWAEILNHLHKVASSSAIEYLSDIHQLEGYCAQMDSDAFIPFESTELTAENAKRFERYYEVIDETAKLIVADGSVTASHKGKASAYRAGYERKLTVDDFIVSLLYDLNLWKSDISVETPFWVGISNKDWQQPEDFRKKFLQIPKHKQDDTVWNTCYFALEPLADATLDEVCANLKQQIFEYIDLLREEADK